MSSICDDVIQQHVMSSNQDDVTQQHATLCTNQYASDVWEESFTTDVLKSIFSCDKSSTIDSDDILQSLLFGCPTFPDFPLTMIKVSLCANPNDTLVEKAAIMSNVYPKLRQYCRWRHGYEFHMVDLTWGISLENVISDRDLAAMRLEEIRKCKMTSVGPNCIVVLGQKYGPVFPPTAIKAVIYDIIIAVLHDHHGWVARNVGLLDNFYVLDNNIIPPAYVLKDFNTTIQFVKEETYGITKVEDTLHNWQTEAMLLLRKGLELARKDNLLDSSTDLLFQLSDLDLEVRCGIEDGGTLSNQCFVLQRNIVDLTNFLAYPQVNFFADVISKDSSTTPCLDKEASSCIQQLKKHVRNAVTPTNIMEYQVLWRHDDVINPLLHRQYLDKMTSDLYGEMKRMVDDAIASQELNQRDYPPLLIEIWTHWNYCKQKATDYFPCQTQIYDIRDYVTKAHTDGPLVLYGTSGCGKTKLVSMLAMKTASLLDVKCLTLVRYARLTRDSCDWKRLTVSIIRQLCLALGLNSDSIPTGVNDILRLFPKFLQSLPHVATVIIIVDGLEKLTDDAHIQDWLPRKLPPHVKLIVTVQSDACNLLGVMISEVLPHSAKSFLSIPPPSPSLSLSFFNRILQESNRKLKNDQMDILAETLDGNHSPFYIKLLAHRLRNLSSTTPISDFCFPVDCNSAVIDFFDRVEENHGIPLVSKAMAYTVASGTGLSDLEMEEVLSMDKTVLKGSFAINHSPNRRFPTVLWLKLRRDMEKFLTVLDSYGLRVSSLEHDGLITEIRRRYLTSDTASFVYSTLADYFISSSITASGEFELSRDDLESYGPSPETCRPSNLSMRSTKETDILINYQVPSNKRMFDLLPGFLHRSGRQDILCSLILFNYEWLYHKSNNLSLSHTMDDFSLHHTEETVLVLEALRDAAPLLEQDITVLSVEVTGRLLPYWNTHANIRALLESCYVKGRQHCALLPVIPYQQVPGSLLKYSLDVPFGADCIKIVFSGRYLLCKNPTRSEIYVYDLDSGLLKDTIITSIGDIYVTPNVNFIVIVDHVTEKSIKIHNARDGAFIGQVIPERHIDCNHVPSCCIGTVCIDDTRLCGIVDVGEKSFLFMCEMTSGYILQMFQLDGRSTLCQMVQHGRYVICNSNERLLSFDLRDQIHVCSVSVGSNMSCCVVSADSKQLFTASENCSALCQLNVNDGYLTLIDRMLLAERLQGDRLHAMRLSPNDHLVLVRASRRLLVFRGTTIGRIMTIEVPTQTPKMFRLPRSQCKEVIFSGAEFADDTCIIATIYRTIYTWAVNGSEVQLLSSIQAQIGLISSLHVNMDKRELVTSMANSRHVQVWRISRTAPKVTIRDKLTAPVKGILLSEDCLMAFVHCLDSDEVGVFELSYGTLRALLTHETPVTDVAITPSGHMAVVSTEPYRKNSSIKVWDITERRIIGQFGNTNAFCLSLNHTNAIVLVSQRELHVDVPYDIRIVHFTGKSYDVEEHAEILRYVRFKPCVTNDDHNIVLSSAHSFRHQTGRYFHPCLLVFNMKSSMRRTFYDAGSVGLDGVLTDILSIHPCSERPSSIAVVASCLTANVVSTLNDRQRIYQSKDSPSILKTTKCIAVFLLDVKREMTTALNFLHPEPFSTKFLFSPNFTTCLDEFSAVYRLCRCDGWLVEKHLFQDDVSPTCLVLNGSIAIYCRNASLLAQRIADSSVIARCYVRSKISQVAVSSSDQRAIIVGCIDGSIFSFQIFDSPYPNSTPENQANE